MSGSLFIMKINRNEIRQREGDEIAKRVCCSAGGSGETDKTTEKSGEG